MGEGPGGSPSEDSHSAVLVTAVVRGSGVPAKGEDKVLANEGRSSIVQVDLTVGSGRRKAGQTTGKYKHGGQRQGHDSSSADRTDQASPDRVPPQRAGPPGQVLHR